MKSITFTMLRRVLFVNRSVGLTANSIHAGKNNNQYNKNNTIEKKNCRLFALLH